MNNLFEETIESIRRNKLRTCLTGFAVTWGIFMLIVLLGAGNGLLNSYTQSTDTFATNTIMVGGGRTTKPYDGLMSGRRIALEEKDVALTKGPLFSQYVDDVVATSGLSVMVTKDDYHVRGYLEGNFPERTRIEKLVMLGGRFINKKDIDDRRKVLIIPTNIAERLVPDGTEPVALLGQEVKVFNLVFTVVGINKSDQMNDNNLLYAPFTTVKDMFNKGKFIDDITLSFHGLDTENENEKFEKKLQAEVNSIHRAAPDDKGAIWIQNRFTQNLQILKGGKILNFALWIIGLFTLLSGIVGVSNIMLITVKERTYEFGIRKAIGANPWNITKLIIGESIVITGLFGYLGMFLGMAACEILDKTLGNQSVDVMGVNIALLIDPTVGIDVAVKATVVLIVTGTLAGIFPARKAAKVRPIEALNAE